MKNEEAILFFAFVFTPQTDQVFGGPGRRENEGKYEYEKITHS